MVSPGVGADEQSDNRSRSASTCVNLSALPQNIDRNEAILTAFNKLNDGQNMLLIDDFHPEWARKLLQERVAESNQPPTFTVNRKAGRYEARIRKNSGS